MYQDSFDRREVAVKIIEITDLHRWDVRWIHKLFVRCAVAYDYRRLESVPHDAAEPVRQWRAFEH